MARIEVNHQELRSAASVIKGYCAYQTMQMGRADSAVQAMITPNVWLGKDAAEFINKWDGIQSEGSVAYNFKKTLTGCYEALEASASLYAKAQENAYNAACHLPKLIW